MSWSLCREQPGHPQERLFLNLKRRNRRNQTSARESFGRPFLLPLNKVSRSVTSARPRSRPRGGSAPGGQATGVKTRRHTLLRALSRGGPGRERGTRPQSERGSGCRAAGRCGQEGRPWGSGLVIRSRAHSLGQRVGPSCGSPRGPSGWGGCACSETRRVLNKGPRSDQISDRTRLVSPPPPTPEASSSRRASNRERRLCGQGRHSIARKKPRGRGSPASFCSPEAKQAGSPPDSTAAGTSLPPLEAGCPGHEVRPEARHRGAGHRGRRGPRSARRAPPRQGGGPAPRCETRGCHPRPSPGDRARTSWPGAGGSMSVSQSGLGRRSRVVGGGVGAAWQAAAVPAPVRTAFWNPRGRRAGSSPRPFQGGSGSAAPRP